LAGTASAKNVIRSVLSTHTKVLASEETFPTVVWCKEVMGCQKGCNVGDLCVEVATIMVLRVCRGNVS
jgi:hypothetical protein